MQREVAVGAIELSPQQMPQKSENTNEAREITSQSLTLSPISVIQTHIHNMPPPHSPCLRRFDSNGRRNRFLPCQCSYGVAPVTSVPSRSHQHVPSFGSYLTSPSSCVGQPVSLCLIALRWPGPFSVFKVFYFTLLMVNGRPRIHNPPPKSPGVLTAADTPAKAIQRGGKERTWTVAEVWVCAVGGDNGLGKRILPRMTGLLDLAEKVIICQRPPKCNLQP